jgi:SMC interacting uncharacterized protein involved in chromosome segregation
LKFRSLTNNRVHECQDEILALQENIDRLQETQQDKFDELLSIESKIKNLNEQYNLEKDVSL